MNIRLQALVLITIISLTGCTKKPNQAEQAAAQAAAKKTDIYHSNVQGRVSNPAGYIITNAVIHVRSENISPINAWFMFNLPAPTDVTIEAPGYKPWSGTMVPNSSDFNVQLQPL
jgi:hypothetical protein